MTQYITVRFTKHQVEVFLKHFRGFTESWLEEEPKGKELLDVRVMERFFQKLEESLSSLFMRRVKILHEKREPEARIEYVAS